MVALRPIDAQVDTRGGLADPDQRVFMQDMPWWQYEAMLAFCGDRPIPRLAYLDGQLELMQPSRRHHESKVLIARLIEIYAYEKRLPLAGYGSMTMRAAPKAAGLEPDECYIIGEDKTVPDLAIEVVWTSGGLDKLEIYRRLGVREVWVWEENCIQVYGLTESGYAHRDRSAVLPDLDIDLLSTYSLRHDQAAAVFEFVDALRDKEKD